MKALSGKEVVQEPGLHIDIIEQEMEFDERCHLSFRAEPCRWDKYYKVSE
jgi:hypothetical protein